MYWHRLGSAAPPIIDNGFTLHYGWIELERRIEVQNQCTASIEGVERFCDLVRTNIKQFSFQDKRLALESLQIKVWIDSDKVTIEGAVPVDEQRIVPNASR